MSKLPALIALTLVLAACGAGQTGTPNVATPAASTAQVIIGTVTALSADHEALTVAGRALHLGLASQGLPRQPNGASIRVNRDDANELALSIGQHVMVQAKDDTAGEIDIEKELRGTVSSFDLKAGTLAVNGQTVTVLPTTRIELSRKESSVQGLTHILADLQIGVFVEVTGERNAPGGVTASSLDVRSAPEHHEQGRAAGHHQRSGRCSQDLSADSARQLPAAPGTPWGSRTVLYSRRAPSRCAPGAAHHLVLVFAALSSRREPHTHRSIGNWRRWAFATGYIMLLPWQPKPLPLVKWSAPGAGVRSPAPTG